MSTPGLPFLKKDQTQALALLKESQPGQLLFSEGTYQVEVKEPGGKKALWPFLQLDDTGKVLDCFCTCKDAEKKKSCPHLAAAYLRIFNDKSDPLHVRFRDSLWNGLCQMASRRHGYDGNILKAGDGAAFRALSSTGKELFFVQPKGEVGKARLKEILEMRALETEETSLKFSNLSPDELALWRSGRPSHQLRYELSFWSDLAKWWMQLQEMGEEYKIEITNGAEIEKAHLPKWILGQFKEVHFGFYIAEVNWPQIIPTLATVRSPLVAHEFSYQLIRQITYDSKEMAFHIDFISFAEEEGARGGGEVKIQVGDYLFIPQAGFFPARIDPLLKERVVPKNKIASALQKHTKVFQKYLKGTTMHRGSIKAQYALFFDEQKALHIQCYLFEEGDLQKEGSSYFSPWAYIEGKGFYLIENVMFSEVEKRIPKALVSDFVNKHRLWLSSFEGFQTHISSLETQLSFTLTEEGSLRFETRLDFSEEVGVIDLGEWIYVKSRGFYAKTMGRPGAFLRPGILVPASDISSFIHKHREELEHIEGFFGQHCPLEKVGLHIGFNENQQIVVSPEYSFLPPHSEATVRLFGDYTFVVGEGFCEMPAEMKLPENYTQTKVIDAQSEPYFIGAELDLLRPFAFFVDPKLRRPKELVLRINALKKDKTAKSGMWIVDLDYESEVGQIDVVEVWRGLNDNQRTLFTSSGLIQLKQPRFNWLKNVTKKKWLKGGRQLRLTTMEWLRLCVFEEIRDPLGNSKEARSSRKLLDEFRSMQAEEELNLEGLKSDLRPYQIIGVRWLWFLFTHGLSGMLCDEMGLGKTHQAMGLVAAAYNSRGERKPKYLVVCPTSVIYHWEALLERFLPGIKVSVFYGSQRKSETFQEEFDLFLTSYGTLRSEKKKLAEVSFEIAIFDEVQIAKNAQSQTHKALRGIDAKMTLGLTGTPIENRLLELKALFDVIVPSYFPSEAIFREQFVSPIEKGQDPEKKALLARFIKPFILRRKKSEVLLELPEKTEEISYCDLSDEQRELYKRSFLEFNEPLMQQLQDRQKPAPIVHVFSLLSKLKQICDHPCLALKDISSYEKHQSGKWELFIQLLEETRDSGQKLVVFSQYLKMLDIIEDYLKKQGIAFAGIRGNTRDRKEQLERFRDDPKCEVFVASLQAAGVGVDLVAASVVIHYDRWWNPAKENQATDRVHRIGQSRGVQVFKMVTRHTIEEHIHRLIEKKLYLAEGVIGFDEHDQIKGLQREELIELLRLMNEDIK